MFGLETNWESDQSGHEALESDDGAIEPERDGMQIN